MPLDELFTRHKTVYDDGDPADLQGGWAGVIAADPGAQGVEVIIPSFSPDRRFGPCFYAPIGELEPKRNDKALIVFDQDRDPWVVVWWPV